MGFSTFASARNYVERSESQKEFSPSKAMARIAAAPRAELVPLRDVPGIPDDLFRTYFGHNQQAGLLACDQLGIAPFSMLYRTPAAFALATHGGGDVIPDDEDDGEAQRRGAAILESLPATARAALMIRYNAVERHRQQQFDELFAQRAKLCREGGIAILWAKREELANAEAADAAYLLSQQFDCVSPAILPDSRRPSAHVPDHTQSSSSQRASSARASTFLHDPSAPPPSQPPPLPTVRYRRPPHDPHLRAKDLVALEKEQEMLQERTRRQCEEGRRECVQEEKKMASDAKQQSAPPAALSAALALVPGSDSTEEPLAASSSPTRRPRPKPPSARPARVPGPSVSQRQIQSLVLNSVASMKKAAFDYQQERHILQEGDDLAAMKLTRATSNAIAFGPHPTGILPSTGYLSTTRPSSSISAAAAFARPRSTSPQSTSPSSTGSAPWYGGCLTHRDTGGAAGTSLIRRSRPESRKSTGDRASLSGITTVSRPVTHAMTSTEVSEYRQQVSASEEHDRANRYELVEQDKLRRAKEALQVQQQRFTLPSEYKRALIDMAKDNRERVERARELKLLVDVQRSQAKHQRASLTHDRRKEFAVQHRQEHERLRDMRRSVKEEIVRLQATCRFVVPSDVLPLLQLPDISPQAHQAAAQLSGEHDRYA